LDVIREFPRDTELLVDVFVRRERLTCVNQSLANLRDVLSLAYLGVLEEVVVSLPVEDAGQPLRVVLERRRHEGARVGVLHVGDACQLVEGRSIGHDGEHEALRWHRNFTF